MLKDGAYAQLCDYCKDHGWRVEIGAGRERADLRVGEAIPRDMVLEVHGEDGVIEALPVPAECDLERGAAGLLDRLTRQRRGP